MDVQYFHVKLEQNAGTLLFILLLALCAFCWILADGDYPWLQNHIYSVIGYFKVLFLEGVENYLVMVMMCEPSYSVLLNEAIKNYK